MAKYTQPLTIKFSDKTAYDGRVWHTDVNDSWQSFTTGLNDVMSKHPHDYIVISLDDNLALSRSVANAIDFRTNHVARTASKQGVNTYSYYKKEGETQGVFYQLNGLYGKGRPYAPTDSMVLAKVAQYGFDISDAQPSNEAWQAHQSKLFTKLQTLMPLHDTQDRYHPVNHKALLTDPKRGLEDNDLKDMFTWSNNKIINPVLMKDDMIGMPGMRGIQTDDEIYYGERLVGTNPIQIVTTGLEGYVIPMRNKNGDMTKFQCGANPSVINMKLKARAKDGVSIQHSEYFDKSSNHYTFTLDGEPSQLKITNVQGDSITFEDRKGTFKYDAKSNMTEFLKGRGYDLPEIIHDLSPQATAKYIWTSKGTFIGSDKINKAISPSEAGFIEAQSSKNGQYDVLVVEGALKGKIVAKYLTKPDETGATLADTIKSNPENGIIVAQVPGVAKAFVESVRHIYDNHTINDVVIAMDADGRFNKSVAKGIHESYQILGDEQHRARVLSWNPDHKGLDDALLAISRHEITLDDLGLQFGTPRELFPMAQAVAPNPYKLDGTRANMEAWRIEDDERKAAQKGKLESIQQMSIQTSSFKAKEDEQVENIVRDIAENTNLFDPTTEIIAQSVGTLLATKSQWVDKVKDHDVLKASMRELGASLAEALEDLNDQSEMTL